MKHNSSYLTDAEKLYSKSQQKEHSKLFNRTSVQDQKKNYPTETDIGTRSKRTPAFSLTVQDLYQLCQFSIIQEGKQDGQKRNRVHVYIMRVVLSKATVSS